MTGPRRRAPDGGRTMPEHTKGPWWVAKCGTAVLCGPERDPLIVCHTDGDDVLHVGNNPDQSEEGQPEANARLIAAAPDLFWTVERLASWNGKGDPTDLINMAREAIAKAEGRAD